MYVYADTDYQCQYIAISRYGYQCQYIAISRYGYRDTVGHGIHDFVEIVEVRASKQAHHPHYSAHTQDLCTFACV